jgi:chromosome segregation ATPase
MQRDSNNAVSNAEQQHRMASLQREKQELAASLAAIRQAETAHRLSTAEASSKVERLRGELLRCVGELQAQLAASASTGQQQQQMQQQLRALEATAAAARAEAAESRQQLVELASVTLAELREQVAGEAVAITGLPEDVGGALPAPVVSYIKVCGCGVCGGSVCNRGLTARPHGHKTVSWSHCA